MKTNPDIVELSIGDLFRQYDYQIPLYQRNYAWADEEIEQLLSDIIDSMPAQPGRPKRNYYLGTLVVDARKLSVFETVDGQQRHTTLGILLAVLKNKYKAALPDITHINLGFDGRPASGATLRCLFQGKRVRDATMEERSMVTAYKICSKFLHQYQAQIPAIADYLLRHVKLVRTTVPPDTDLNHYFEIMNNRGEQLAKHEVLKARLMEQLPDPQMHRAFAEIWDACADMGRYVQMSFSLAARGQLFGASWNCIPDSFERVVGALGTADEEEGMTLAEIVDGAGHGHGQDKEDEIAADDPGTVVNFPNFLLHVLRVSTVSDIALDDKRLLSIFDSAAPDPQKFLMSLLRCRMLLDRYVVRRKTDGSWTVNTIASRKVRKSYTREDQPTFKGEMQRQITMLLSMFHVSTPTQTYKHWLSTALHYLYQASFKVSGNGDALSGKEYLNWMEVISDRFLFGRFGEGGQLDFFPLCFDAHIHLPSRLDEANLHCGTHVQNFIFNRLDYLLWKHVRDKRVFAGVDMDWVLPRQKKFVFTFRSSVEHHYPQNPHGGHPRMKPSKQLRSGCDTFGNLCLLSGSINSKLNNVIPSAKRGHYSKSTAVESLKQAFMFGHGDNWGPDYERVVAAHEKMMIDILCERTAPLGADGTASGLPNRQASRATAPTENDDGW